MLGYFHIFGELWVVSDWLYLFMFVLNSFLLAFFPLFFFSFSKLVCNCFIYNSLSGALSVFIFVMLLNALMTSSSVSFSWWRFFGFVFVSSDSVLVSSCTSFMLTYFLSSFFIFLFHLCVFFFQFLRFYYYCFIFTFQYSLCFVDFVLFANIFYFFLLFLHYFFTSCSFTFEFEISLSVYVLYPLFNIFVTLHAVFVFDMPLFIVFIIISCCIFFIVWPLSYFNLYAPGCP